MSNGDESAAPSLDDVDAVFLALAHEARRHIVLLLSQRGGELPSGYLAAHFQHSWPTTTRHLNTLAAAGIVEVRRDGRSSHYRLNRDRLRKVLGGWLELVEPVGPEQTWTSTGPKHSSSNRHEQAGKTKDRERNRSMSTPKIFRVTLEVSNLDEAATLYAELLDTPGIRHPGARHYFECGGVVLAVLDPTQGGVKPTPMPKSLYFAVDDVEAVQARAKKLGVLAPFAVHGQPAGDVIDRPWGERSFYVTDKWGNELCFVKEGTLYT